MAQVIEHGKKFDRFYCYDCGCRFYEEKAKCDIITIRGLNYFRTECPECGNDCVVLIED